MVINHDRSPEPERLIRSTRPRSLSRTEEFRLIYAAYGIHASSSHLNTFQACSSLHPEPLSFSNSVRVPTFSYESMARVLVFGTGNIGAVYACILNQVEPMLPVFVGRISGK